MNQHIWRMPLALAVCTMVGLLSALLGEHWLWKTIGWLGLLLPMLVALYYALLRRYQRR